MLRDSLIAAIRTGVAALVGFVVTWLIAQGIELDDAFALNLTMAVTVLVIAVYNWLVNLLERKVNPLFGILLGIPKAPAYGSVGTTTPPVDPPAAVDVALADASTENPPA